MAGECSGASHGAAAPRPDCAVRRPYLVAWYESRGRRRALVLPLPYPDPFERLQPTSADMAPLYGGCAG